MEVIVEGKDIYEIAELSDGTCSYDCSSYQ